MSNPQARVVATSGGVCCPCSSQTDPCNCADSGCGLSCRARASEATLCGYSEFGTPSVPPKKYRHTHRTSTVGPSLFFGICTYQHEPCDEPACAANFSSSCQVFNPDSVVTINGVLNNLGPDGFGNIQYQAVCSASVTFLPSGPTVPLGAQIVVHGCGADITFNTGDSHLIPISCGTASVEVFTAFGIGGTRCPAKCMSIETPSVLIADFWEYTGQFNKDTCAFADADSSYRAGSQPCDGTPSGHGAIPGGDPGTVYGAGVSFVITDTVTRGWVGALCLGGGFTSYAGTITETLSDEDTDEDAEKRAVVGIDWTTGTCDNNTAFRTARGAGEFTFGFRMAQVQASAGFGHPLTPLHVYEITISFYRRVEGSIGPFTFFGTFVVTFVADAPVHVTDWIDIPNEEGWETKASGCSLRDITPP